MQRTSVLTSKGVVKDEGEFYFHEFVQCATTATSRLFSGLGFTAASTLCQEPGVHAGKKPGDIDCVPLIWPDDNVVRRDMLDYAVAVERFDKQVGALVGALEAAGEFDNTLVIVTSDNGMPFPRSKGNTYEISTHMPLVACWPRGISEPRPYRQRPRQLRGSAPTFELLGIAPEKTGMAPVTGCSFTDLLRDEPRQKRAFVLLGRERNDWGTPESARLSRCGGIVQDNRLLLVNFKPDRWPAGNPEAYYPDVDDGPTKSLVVDVRVIQSRLHRFWELSFGMRPEASPPMAAPTSAPNIPGPGLRTSAERFARHIAARPIASAKIMPTPKPMPMPTPT